MPRARAPKFNDYLQNDRDQKHKKLLPEFAKIYIKDLLAYILAKHFLITVLHEQNLTWIACIYVGICWDWQNTYKENEFRRHLPLWWAMNISGWVKKYLVCLSSIAISNTSWLPKEFAISHISLLIRTMPERAILKSYLCFYIVNQLN